MEKTKFVLTGGVFSIVGFVLCLSFVSHAQTTDENAGKARTGKDGTTVIPNTDVNNINSVKKVESKTPVEADKEKADKDRAAKEKADKEKKTSGVQKTNSVKTKKQKGVTQQGQAPGKKVRRGDAVERTAEDTVPVEGDKDNTTVGDQMSLMSTQKASGDPKASCEDAALRKIHEHALKDQGNVLAEMFELVALKLAKRAAEEQQVAIEDKVQLDIQQLEERLEAMKGSEEIRAEVGKIYETYGLAGDAEAIQKDLAGAIKKGRDACYWSRSQRLENGHSSAYILAVSVGESHSGLSKNDAATVWVVEKLRAAAAKRDPRYRYGKFNGNLMNVSVRTARYLGRIHGGVALTPDQLQAEIERRESLLASVFAGAVKAVEKELQDCITKRNNNCSTCDKKDMDQFKAEISKVGALKSGLLEAVAKSDGAKIFEDLKAKMGEVTFDFSNYAQGDSIPRDPRYGKVDACAERKKQRSPGQAAAQGEQASLLNPPQWMANTVKSPEFVTKMIEKMPDAKQMTDEQIKNEFDLVRSGYQQQNPGAHAPYDKDLYLKSRSEFKPWILEHSNRVPAVYGPKQQAALNQSFDEWQKILDLWLSSTPNAKPLKYDPAKFKAWKVKMQTWIRNHPNEAPPPNDPYFEVDQALLNTYMPVDLKCVGCDCVGGKRVRYQFATPLDCQAKCKTQSVHKPH